MNNVYAIVIKYVEDYKILRYLNKEETIMNKSVFGLNENVAGLLCYVLGFFSGIVILIMERENKFVRFHALQSTLWFVLLSILNWIVGGLAIIGTLLAVVTIASWAFLMYQAYNGEKFKIPMIGDAVEKHVGA